MLQRKKHFGPGGLAALALVAYLLRGDELDDFLLSPDVPDRGGERRVSLGEVVGLFGVDAPRSREPPLFMKDADAYVESVFRDIRMLAEYPHAARFDVVSAYLVDADGTAPVRGGGTETAARSQTAGTARLTASVDAGDGLAMANTAAATVPHASEPTAEDMDLIDILWRQDMDMGVGRETYDPVLRLEMEKERQAELKKQAEKEAAAAAAEKSLLMSNFTVDPETGELIPIGSFNSSPPAAAEKAFETGFWSRQHLANAVAEDPATFSLEDLLESTPTSPPAAAASAIEQDMSVDSLLSQLQCASGFGLPTTPAPGIISILPQPAYVVPHGQHFGTLACATAPLTAVEGAADAVHSLPPAIPHHVAWNEVGGGCRHELPDELTLLSASAAAAAAAQPGWQECADGEEQAYDFTFFSGLDVDEEDDDGTEGACGATAVPELNSSFASLFDGVPDLDLGNLDMDCLDMVDNKQMFDGLDVTPFFTEPDDSSVSSDSAISMDVPNFSEDFSIESSSESHSSTDFGSDFMGAAAPRSRSKKSVASSRVDSVQHNHTYTAPPGGQPHVRKMDLKKQAALNDTTSKDERLAKDLGLPFTVEALVSAPVEEFNSMVRSHSFTDEQLRLIRDIRRRGKNKVAAQNCRRRKLGAIVELGESLESLRERRRLLLEQRTALRRQTGTARAKLVALYDGVFGSLRSGQGLPYERSHYELRLASSEDAQRRRLLLLPTVRGTGIGATALRQAIASSTSLLPTAGASSTSVAVGGAGVQAASSGAAIAAEGSVAGGPTNAQAKARPRTSQK